MSFPAVAINDASVAALSLLVNQGTRKTDNLDIPA